MRRSPGGLGVLYPSRTDSRRNLPAKEPPHEQNCLERRRVVHSKPALAQGPQRFRPLEPPGNRRRRRTPGGRPAPVQVVRRREPPAARRAEEAVVAQVVVAVRDQHREDDPPPEFRQIPQRVGPVPADGFGDVRVGPLLVIRRIEHRQGRNEGDASAGVAVEATEDQDAAAGRFLDAGLGGADPGPPRQRERHRLPARNLPFVPLPRELGEGEGTVPLPHRRLGPGAPQRRPGRQQDAQAGAVLVRPRIHPAGGVEQPRQLRDRRDPRPAERREKPRPRPRRGPRLRRGPRPRPLAEPHRPLPRPVVAAEQEIRLRQRPRRLPRLGGPARFVPPQQLPSPTIRRRVRENAEDPLPRPGVERSRPQVEPRFQRETPGVAQPILVIKERSALPALPGAEPQLTDRPGKPTPVVEVDEDPARRHGAFARRAPGRSAGPFGRWMRCGSRSVSRSSPTTSCPGSARSRRRRSNPRTKRTRA